MPPLRRAARKIRRRTFPGSAEYWERRYRRGKTSGPGSYGEYARFKASFLNALVAGEHVESVVEFGCGDGNQLQLASYPRYVGLDVSQEAIARCRRLFAGDATKSFELYDPESFVPRPRGDLGLSLDVILHLVEEAVFDRHLDHLFASAQRLVAIYGSDIDRDPGESAAHVRWRAFTSVIERRFPDWTLETVTPGIEPSDRSDPRTDFFVYRRT